MAFWNRKKKKLQREQDEALEREAREKLDALREKKKEGTTEKKVQAKQPAAKSEMQYKRENRMPTQKKDQKRYAAECCEAIQDVDRQIAEVRREYQSVTDYLMDIQKIDRVAGEEKRHLRDIARNIARLTKERNQYKNRHLSISDLEIRRLELYETDLVTEIKKMYEAEAYQKAIDGDMEKLEQEKKKLRKEKQEIVEKQNSLKRMAKVLIVLIFSLFILFAVVYYALQTDMTYPYLGTVLLAAVSSTAIFVESNRNRRDMALAERKMDKAVSLLNRVKIKCVNNLNVLDYNRQKFGVQDGAHFERLWTEYCKAKEYERKFRENTEQLNAYNEELLGFLKEKDLKDCEIWMGQVLALVDDREMVEIRHKLNGQRQQLREQIEYNEGVKKGILEEVDTLIKENPDNRKEILDVVEAWTKGGQEGAEPEG
ncbi:MAG: hypothetical protein LUH14_07595 [Clostridiaceae bacterium]|nr:hypothetical protein [Clostridiaceae bacterium]